MTSKQKRNLAVAELSGRAVERPRTEIVDQGYKQELFLMAYAKHGILTESLRASGTKEGDYHRWMTQDEVFAGLFQEARRAWGDKIREWVNNVAMDGVPEPVVYKGQIQYERDPDTGEIVYDVRGQKVPVMVPKRDNRVLLRLAEANLDEFAKGRAGGDHSKGPKAAPTINITFKPVEDGRLVLEGSAVEVPDERIDYDPFA